MMGNYPSDRPSAWAHIRTLFIAVHLLAITLMALPAPSGGMSRSAWKDPTVQAEFGRGLSASMPWVSR